MSAESFWLDGSVPIQFLVYAICCKENGAAPIHETFGSEVFELFCYQRSFRGRLATNSKAIPAAMAKPP
jgi:hypothetical protein